MTLRGVPSSAYPQGGSPDDLRWVESDRPDGLLLRPRAFQTGFPGGHPETPSGGSSPPTGPPGAPSATGAGSPGGPLGPLILGGAQKGQKWRILDPLRCKVVREWGGSAH